MIAPGPTLETARLILRPTAAEDLDGWAELMDDAEAARFIGGRQTRSDAWRGMMSMAGSWATLGFGMFSLIEKGSGDWLGRIGPWRPEGWPGNEIGWSVLRKGWGKGYAAEAATAAIDWAFDTLGWEDVIHCIDPENVNSQAVARKLGSRNLGPGQMPPPLQDLPIDIWGQSKGDWRTRRF